MEHHGADGACTEHTEAGALGFHLLPPIGIGVGAPQPCPVLTWVLGTQAQTLVLAQQVVSLTELSLQPLRTILKFDRNDKDQTGGGQS